MNLMKKIGFNASTKLYTLPVILGLECKVDDDCVGPCRFRPEICHCDKGNCIGEWGRAKSKTRYNEFEYFTFFLNFESS